MCLVKRERLEPIRLFYVSFYGITLYIVAAKNGLWVLIIYHNLPYGTISISAKLASSIESFYAILVMTKRP